MCYRSDWFWKQSRWKRNDKKKTNKKEDAYLITHHQTDAYRTSAMILTIKPVWQRFTSFSALQLESSCFHCVIKSMMMMIREIFFHDQFHIVMRLEWFQFGCVIRWWIPKKMFQHRINYRRRHRHHRNYVSSVWPPFFHVCVCVSL